MNPSVRLAPLTYRSLPFSVIRDDVLSGGTKQRGLPTYLQSFAKASEFVYAGFDTDSEQIGIAQAGTEVGMPVVLYVTSLRDYSAPEHQLAITYGARSVHSKSDLKAVLAEATKYTRADIGRVLLPMDLNDSYYLSFLIESLRIATDGLPEPKRLWVATTDGILLQALATLWSNTLFLAVSLTKPLTNMPTVIRSRIKEYPAFKRYKPFESVKSHEEPPYPSSPIRDAKIWIFAKDEMQPGDWIWNSTGQI